jgi:tripartite ATP-independent transporter DctM subunit
MTIAPADEPSAQVSRSKIMSWLSTSLSFLIEAFDRVGRVVIVTALSAELMVVITEITIRSLYSQSLLWGEEASKLTLLTVGFVGGAVAYRGRQHMSIDMLTKLLGRKVGPIIEAMIEIFTLLASVIMTFTSLDLLEIARMSYTPLLHLNGGWMMAPFTTGLCLFAVFAAERLFKFPAPTACIAAVLVAVIVGIVLLASFLGVRLSSSTTLVIMLVTFMVAILSGLIVSVAMILGSLLFMSLTDLAPPVAVAQNMIDGLGHFILLALPFFVIAGMIMERGGISERLVRFAMVFVGHLKGGLLQVVVVTTYFVSGISGSKAADVVAVGSIMREQLKQHGYRPEEAAAVLAASAAMSETIPPSIAMLVIGSVVPISMGTLFVAGLLPAAIIALLLMVSIYFLARRSGIPPAARATLPEIRRAVIGAILPLAMPMAMLIGIRFGIATPTEVSAVAVAYGLFLSLVVYRAISFAELYRVAVDAALLTGMVLFIVAAASAFAWTLSAADLPTAIVSVVHFVGDRPAVFLIGTIILMTVVGSLVEGLPALIILAPLLMPIAVKLGIDNIHYSMVLILSMGVGVFLPPVGVGFYIACAVANSRIEDAAKSMMPYLVVLLAGVLAVAFVPWFTHAVPKLLGDY